MVGCTRRRPGDQGSLRGALNITTCSRFGPVCLGARAEKPRPEVATLPSRRMRAPLRTWRALGGAGELCAHGGPGVRATRRSQRIWQAWSTRRTERACMATSITVRGVSATCQAARPQVSETFSEHMFHIISTPIPRGQCWREIRLVLPRCDLLRRANFESRGGGAFVNCFRVPSHVPTPAITCERNARFRKQGFLRNHRSGGCWSW